jgi:hypothetical protein
MDEYYKRLEVNYRGTHNEDDWYPLDRNGSRLIRAARATTSPHIQKWSSEAILFIKSLLVANKTFY